MKDQKGEPAFPENIDELLAEKIVRHSKQASDVRPASGDRPASPKKERPPSSENIRTPKPRLTIVDVLAAIFALWVLIIVKNILSGKRRWIFLP